MAAATGQDPLKQEQGVGRGPPAVLRQLPYPGLEFKVREGLRTMGAQLPVWGGWGWGIETAHLSQAWGTLVTRLLCQIKSPFFPGKGAF